MANPPRQPARFHVPAGPNPLSNRPESTFAVGRRKESDSFHKGGFQSSGSTGKNPHTESDQTSRSHWTAQVEPGNSGRELQLIAHADAPRPGHGEQQPEGRLGLAESARQGGHHPRVAQTRGRVGVRGRAPDGRAADG